jgi:hypothetical protein
MLTRRVLAAPSGSTFARSLSSSASLRKAPSLAQITPDKASEFDRKQQEFRESQRAAAKANREADSKRRSQSTSAPSFAGESVDKNGNLGLGSLTTSEAARDKQSESESSKRTGKLASLIYGTKEGKEMDQEIEKSFSQVLARGKYVHSIVFHQVKPDKVDEYTKLVGDWYPRVAGLKDNHVHLVGSWRTEVGDCDTFGKLTQHFTYDAH